MINEYKENYGSTKKIKKFFEKYISKHDKNYILNYYQNGKFTDIDKFITDIYQLRSNFVHNLGVNCLIQGSIVTEYKLDGSHKQIKYLDINNLCAIIWFGILEKLGLNALMTE